MKRVLLVIVLCLAALCPATAQTPKPLRIAVISNGGSQLTNWFINDLKTAQTEAGLSIEFVGQADARLDYVVLVQGMAVRAGIVIVDLARQLAALTKG